MILVSEEGRGRHRRFVVCCDEHGEIGRQTDLRYGCDRARLHQDETGCTGGGIAVVWREGDRWRVSWCSEACRWTEAGSRSSRAAAIALARRHAESREGR